MSLTLFWPTTQKSYFISGTSTFVYLIRHLGQTLSSNVGYYPYWVVVNAEIQVCTKYWGYLKFEHLALSRILKTLLKSLRDAEKEETEIIQEPEERENFALPPSGHDRVMAFIISQLPTLSLYQTCLATFKHTLGKDSRSSIPAWWTIEYFQILRDGYSLSSVV